MPPKRPSSRHQPQGLIILYEDRDIIVVDKAPGLLTVGTDREGTQTAYFRLTDYVRKGCAKSRNRVYIVHRLDREASGILVFAKTIEAKETLQEEWDDAEKAYLAVVHGPMAQLSGTITSYLTENRALVVYSTPDPQKGKLSKTAYRVIRETSMFSMLDVHLLTGRKHQIRVHLSEKGHPIVGDKKYGGAHKLYKRLALHAKSLSFNHPYTGKPMTLETRTPPYFNFIMGGGDPEAEPHISYQD